MRCLWQQHRGHDKGQQGISRAAPGRVTGTPVLTRIPALSATSKAHTGPQSLTPTLCFQHNRTHCLTFDPFYERLLKFHTFACGGFVFVCPPLLFSHLFSHVCNKHELYLGLLLKPALTSVFTLLLPARSSIVCKASRGVASQHLFKLLHFYILKRSLRSASQLLLVVPQTRLRSRGDRAPTVAASRLWNSFTWDLPRPQRCLDPLSTLIFLLHLFTSAQVDTESLFLLRTYILC